MTDQTKRVSEFSVTSAVASDDRLLVLTNPDSYPEVKTVTVNTIIDSVRTAGGYVNANNLASNLTNYQTTAGLPGAVAVLNCNNASYFNGYPYDHYVTVTELNSNVDTLISKIQFETDLSNYVTKTQFSANLTNYQTTSGLTSNVVKLTANNSSYLNGLPASEYITNSNLTTFLSDYVTSQKLSSNLANYQTTAGLSANVARLTANAANYIGSIAAANVISDSVLTTTLESYLLLSGLSSNVAKLNANNSSYLGGVEAASYVTDTELTNNLANYALISSLPAQLTSNDSLHLGGIAANSYQTTAGLSSNVATLTANNSSYVGGIAAEEIKKYDVACWIANTISASEVVFGFTSVRNARFAGNFANSKGLSLTASTGTYTMSVKKNGVDVGTITFSSSNSATFATTGGANVDIVANDFISIVGNSTPDATLADISITLKGILI